MALLSLQKVTSPVVQVTIELLQLFTALSIFNNDVPGRFSSCQKQSPTGEVLPFTFQSIVAHLELHVKLAELFSKTTILCGLSLKHVPMWKRTYLYIYTIPCAQTDIAIQKNGVDHTTLLTILSASKLHGRYCYRSSTHAQWFYKSSYLLISQHKIGGREKSLLSLPLDPALANSLNGMHAM